MGFRNRLALFLLVTLISVQSLTAFAVYNVARHNVIEQGKRELSAAAQVFMRQLDALSGRVSDGVDVLALDYALRQAIAERDRETALSMLRNHGRRVGATRMILIELDGAITVDTQDAQATGRSFAFSGLLARAAADGRGMGLAALDGAVYWIVIVPVRAPVPIAFIAACLPVDNMLLENLRQLSVLPMTIALATTEARGRWNIAAQSEGARPAPHLPANLERRTVAAVTEDPGHEYLTLTTRLQTAAGSPPVVAVIDYPLAAVLRQYRAVIVPMLAVLAAALLVALIGTTLIARSVSRPVEALAAAARRIEAGDYRPPPAIAGHNELGQLSAALASMVQAVSQRESALTAAVADREAARDAALRANEAKSQFLANMSHELRTPLNAVIGFAEMMRGQILGPLGAPRYREYAEHVVVSGRHLLALVEDMLDLSKVEAGKLSIRREALELAPLLEASLTMLRPLAEEEHVQVDVAGDFRQWPPIEGDLVKMKQVFVNIIGNAIKFTPVGGRVTIAGELRQDTLCIRITDTGIGMRAEDIPLVYKPFHRLQEAFDARHQGAGLGLPLAKAVVELHGGSLAIESALGKGTRVTITLPRGAYPASAIRRAGL